MKDFRQLNEAFRSFVKRDDSHDSEKRGDDPNTMGTSLNSGYMQEERMLWEVTDDEMKAIKKYLGPENADKLSFDELFNGSLRTVIPFPTSSSNDSPIVKLHQFFSNIGWQVDLSNGTVEREEASVRPDTGEEVSRKKSVRIGKMLKKLVSLLNKYHSMSLDVVKEETRGLQKYFKEHGVSEEELFTVVRKSAESGFGARHTIVGFNDFYENGDMDEAIEDVLMRMQSFSDVYKFQQSFLNKSKTTFNDVGFVYSMDIATAFAELNTFLLNAYLTIVTEDFDRLTSKSAKARLAIKREVREILKNQIKSVKNQRFEFTEKFKKDFYLTPWQFEPSQVSTLAQFWNEKSEFYINNPDALKESKYSIVISRSPIDVLRMSDFREIESCHSPKSRGQGSYWQCAVAEARGQGLVAYVVEKKDLDRVDLNADEIFEDDKRGVDGIVPLARLRLRKYGFKGVASDGGIRFAAIPEKRVYGMRFPELYKTVLNWAKENQIDQQFNGDVISSTVYEQSGKGVVRYGGSYQDTPDAELVNDFFGEHVLSLYGAVEQEDTETNTAQDIIAKITGQVMPLINRVNDALDDKFEDFSEETGTIWSQLRLEYEIRPELPERPLLYYLKGVMQFDDERLMLSDKKLYLSSTHRIQLENKIQSAIVERMKKAGGDEHPISVFQVELERDRVTLYRQGARNGSQLYTYDVDGLRNYVDLVVPDFAKSDFVNIVERILTAAAVIYPKQKPANMDMGEFKALVQKAKGPKPDEMSWGEYLSDLPDLGIKKDEPESKSIDWRDYVRQADALQQRINQQDRPAEPEKDEDEEQIDEVSSLVDSLMNLSKKDKLLRELTDDEYERVYNIVHGIKPEHLSFNNVFGGKKRIVVPFSPGPTGELAEMMEALADIGARINFHDGTIEKETTSTRKDTGEEIKSIKKMKVNKFLNKAISFNKKLSKISQEKQVFYSKHKGNYNVIYDPTTDIGKKYDELEKKRNDFYRKASKEFGYMAVSESWIPMVEKWMKFWQEKGEYYRQNPQAAEGETGVYSLVITRAPIDVLRMSDFDDITSCHSPKSRGGGSYYHCAVEEARGHGPVAFVVKNSDIEKAGLDLDGQGEEWQNEEVFVDRTRAKRGIEPLSRVRVRKYINNETGISIAVPETSTYGKRFPNLVGAVQQFFREAQQREMQELEGQTDLSEYIRLGGSYADSSDEDLFDSFFETEGFYGDAEIDAGEEQEEDEYEQVVEQASEIQRYADNDLEHSSVSHEVEEYDGEIHVLFSGYGKIDIDYELDTSEWANFEIEEKIKEILYDKVLANIENVEFSEWNGGAEIEIVFSNYDYPSSIDGFEEFADSDIKRGFDDRYGAITKALREMFLKIGVAQSTKKDDYFAKVASAYKDQYNENIFKNFYATFDEDDNELIFDTKEEAAIPVDSSIFVSGAPRLTYTSDDKFTQGVEFGSYEVTRNMRKTVEASGFQRDIWNILLKLFNKRLQQPLLPNIPPNASDFDINVDFPIQYFQLTLDQEPYKLPNGNWLAKIGMRASFTGVVEDEDFVAAMQLLDFLDDNYEKLVKTVQEKLPEFVSGVDDAMKTLSSIMEVSKLTDSIINEVEPFQKDTIKKHPKRKKMTIGLGGNKSTGGGPFKKKPSMKKNKSAPPGAGGV